jgi:hypothetical protein
MNYLFGEALIERESGAQLSINLLPALFFVFIKSIDVKILYKEVK